MKRYRICWKSKRTGTVRRGSWLPISEDAARQWVVRENAEWPDLYHWYEVKP